MSPSATACSASLKMWATPFGASGGTKGSRRGAKPHRCRRGPARRTRSLHGYGTYTATIAPPAQTFTGQHKGLVTAFFTFTNNSDDMTLENGVNGHDEIDFEIMGRAPNVSNGIDDPATCNALAGNPNIMVVQTNYFVKGTGNHEIAYCLAFGTYKYQFDWTPTGITWRYHNGSAWQQLRTVSYSTGDGPT